MLKIMLKKVICIICAVPLLAVLSLAPLRILAEEDGGYGQAGACAENGILDGEAGDGSAVMLSSASGRRAFTDRRTSLIPCLATPAMAFSCSLVASGATSTNMTQASMPVIIPVREWPRVS